MMSGLSNLLGKRGASSSTSTDDENAKKVCTESEINATDSEIGAGGNGNEVKKLSIDESKPSSSQASSSMDEASNVGKNDEDGDELLFQMFDAIVNRPILKIDVLEMGVKYKCVGAYTKNVDDRVAGVAKFEHPNGQITDVWMPEMLLRNFESVERCINLLQQGIERNQFMYMMFKGCGVSKRGSKFYDCSWVRKNSA